MAGTALDMVGIGNAVVDVLTHADDEFLKNHNMPKGAMTLVDAETAHRLYEDMGPAVEVSGGSAANTMAGFAGLGGEGGFIGKVRNDQLGGIFSHDIRAGGVRYETAPAQSGAPTARCLIFVTPDAQRTMQTFLGASVELGPDDLDRAFISQSQITYLEGYLWASPTGRAAVLEAAKIARDAGKKVSFTLSDQFLVDQYRAEFHNFIDEYVDILFANEGEVTALVEASDFDLALQKVRKICDISALTRSEKGAVILSGDEVHVVDAEPLGDVIDTTGAGDLFASGFLYGITQNKNLGICGRIGNIAAGEIISHFGARPEQSLSALVEKKLGA